MKKFLAIFLGSASDEKVKEWNSMDEATKRNKLMEGMTAWQSWGEKYAKSVVDQGGPLGKTKRTDASGVSDTKNLMAAYVIIEAESHEAAAKMFLNHPHFMIFPGESVEIMECLPIPKI